MPTLFAVSPPLSPHHHPPVSSLNPHSSWYTEISQTEADLPQPLVSMTSLLTDALSGVLIEETDYKDCHLAAEVCPRVPATVCNRCTSTTVRKHSQ
eukprot:1541519-Rhodomonas_salina.1